VTPERKRGLIRTGGLGLFALVAFIVSFVLAFPYDRIKDQVIAIASTQNLDVDVGSAGPVFGMGVAFDEVVVRTRPEPGHKASLLQIDKAKVHVSPLAQLRGVLAYDVDMQALDGRIEAAVSAEKTLGTTKITTREIAMAQLPGVKEAINLPLGGVLDLDLDLAAPNNRNGEANGNLTWKWAGMSIGDGKEKLKIAGNPLLAEGISLPKVRLGDFGGKVVFQKGVGRLQGVGGRSQDAEVRIEGEVRLADPLVYTNLDLYVTFKFSDALLKSADKLQLMLQFADSTGKRADGFYGFRISGAPGRFGPVQWMKASPFPPGPGARASLDGPARANPVAAHVPPSPPPPLPPPPAPALERAAEPTTKFAALPPSSPMDDDPPPPASPPAPAMPGQGEPGGLPPNANVPRYATSPPRE
jgi:type II secretion system protein N